MDEDWIHIVLTMICSGVFSVRLYMWYALTWVENNLYVYSYNSGSTEQSQIRGGPAQVVQNSSLPTLSKQCIYIWTYCTP